MFLSKNGNSSVGIIVWFISIHLTHVAISINCDLEPRNNDGKLRKFLLCKYDKTVHPSLRNDPVIVTLEMIVKGFSFNEDEKILKISSWFSKSWKDDNLKWIPGDYNGITELVESSKLLWQPDLQLYNSDIATVQKNKCKDVNCAISYTGHVNCTPPCVYSAPCAVDFVDWPFDTLSCVLGIGSWMNSADEVDFKLKEVIVPESDLQSQDKSWKMVRVVYVRNHGSYEGTSKRYPSANFEFTLQHSGIHAVAFLTPALIMASLNLITLWMSPEKPQRLMLSALNVLSHFLHMQLLSWYVPFNGDTCPKIVLCFRDSLIITGVLLINTVVVRGFTSCGLDVPNWVGSTTGFVGSNKFGQLFLSKSYLTDRKQPLHSEQSEEASDVSVSEPQTLPTVAIKPLKNPWVLLASYIDRLLFIIVLVLYVYMYFTLVPRRYNFAEPTAAIEIFGE